LDLARKATRRKTLTTHHSSKRTTALKGKQESATNQDKFTNEDFINKK